MDFRRLSRAFAAANTGESGTGGENNATEIDITRLPSNLLEAIIPGYGVLARYVEATLHVDISVFVSLGLVIVGLTRVLTWLAEKAERGFRAVCVSSVYIDEDDDLFDMVMGWLAEQQGAVSRRRVRAKTQRGSAALEVSGGKDGEGAAEEVLDDSGMFDYNKWAARTPPRFEPYYGRHILWHKGRLFALHRTRRTQAGQTVQVQFGGHAEDDMIQLDCIGRSTEPIRKLLRTIKTWSVERLRNTTTIRHPTPKDRGRWGGAWSKTTSRPSRPMDTVILDGAQKAAIVEDMNEYLHPSSQRWYATRGIPYRRGYLFHGPPGTGKTSLSFALAGIFGLEIYVMSLQEPTLTEGDLMQLFNGLPRRCIVLIEDVDAAGLLRDANSGSSEAGKRNGRAGEKIKKKEGKEEDKKKEEGEKEGGKEKEKKEGGSEQGKKDDEYTLRDLAKELRSISSAAGRGGGNNSSSSHNANRDHGKPNGNNTDATGGHPNRAPGTGISLSGLLNAIDGVATHEGRVLILTTNHPEKLDAALVRPGRIDRKVAFRLATREQVAELFVRMYAASGQVPETARLGETLAAESGPGEKDGQQQQQQQQQQQRKKQNQLARTPTSELERLSLEFAAHVPDDTFTPAEIQNHLMRHKKEPRTAVDTARTWVEALLTEKQELETQQLEGGAEEGQEGEAKQLEDEESDE